MSKSVTEFIDCVKECAKDVTKGNVPMTGPHKANFCRRRKDVRALAIKKTCVCVQVLHVPQNAHYSDEKLFSSKQERRLRLWSMDTKDIDLILRRRVRDFDGIFSIDVYPTVRYCLSAMSIPRTDPVIMGWPST